MGWSNGTEIAQYIANTLVEYVPKDKLKEEAQKALGELEAMDWDCQDEVDLFNYLLILDTIKKDAMDRVEEYKEIFGF